MSAQLLDETKYHAEAQASPLADILCGEEWIEDLLLNFGRHPGAGITDRQQYVLA